MPRYFFIILFIIFLSKGLYGQTLEYKQVFSTEELKDGSDCLITSEKSSQFCNLVLTSDERCNMVYDFKSSAKFKDITEVASSTQIFKIKKIEDKFYLYMPENESYVSIVNQSITSQTALYNMFALSADARNEITIEDINNITELKIGDKFVRFHRTADTYRTINKVSTDYLTVKLFLIQEKGEDPVLELNSDTDLKNIKFTGTIKFNRNFEVGYFNTIVLPFTINSPWEVFGEEVEIYEPIIGNSEEIGFKKLEKGKYMVGYTPYLLGGAFSAPPYIIKNVTLNYNSVGTKLKTTIGEQILYSVFQKKQLGNTTNFVLYKNQFRNCQNIKTLYIEPYKWYLMQPQVKTNSRNWEKVVYLNVK